MKLALCLFGEPRYVKSEIAYNLYKEFILNEYEVDVYGHTWIADFYQPSSWSNSPDVVGSKDIPDVIRDQYKGIKLVAETARSFHENRNRNNFISQIYSINEVANLIENPDQYQFILIGRYDLLLSRFESINDLTEGYYSTNRHPIFADQLVFLSPKYLPALKLFDSIDQVQIGSGDIISVERFKLDCFERLFPGDQVSKHDFMVSIIRNL